MKKSAFVHNVFSAVADKYDLMNNLMSFGVHHFWKNELLKEINLQDSFALLDVAGGTGDIAARVLKKYNSSKVTICDNNFSMIEKGIVKTTNAGHVNIKWLCGDAEKLPLPSDHYDYYTIAFGIRNVANIDFALEEAYRVLKPGGKFICLEFSKVEDSLLLSKIYEMYSDYIIPLLGKVVAGNKEAYQYLVDSIREFPVQEKFSGLISDAGFININFRNLSCGITAIHSAWKVV